MYKNYFNLEHEPFSIAPDPRFLYMSAQHKEALAHLLYGIQSSGAFVVLTGEVGAGKTTVCRCFLQQIPNNVDVAFLLNPKLDASELLASICDELQISYPKELSVKSLVDAINQFLLENHGKQRNTVVIIEEAQNLSLDVLEQLRLLTNLETNEKKLLQIILLGQPELLSALEKDSMKQLSQRITARFHLKTLSKEDCYLYLRHRLAVAGAKKEIFSRSASDFVYKVSGGVPRLINVISDRAMLGTYSSGGETVSKAVIRAAAKEVRGEGYNKASQSKVRQVSLLAMVFLLVFVVWQAVLVWQDSSNFVVDFTADKEAKPFQYAKAGEMKATKMASMGMDQFVASKASYQSSLQDLFALWGLGNMELGRLDICQAAYTQQLACLISKGNIGVLKKLDRPVILKLLADTGLPFYAILTRADEKNLYLSIDGQHFELSADELEEYWLGEYQMLWKPPPGFSGATIKPEDRGEAVVWLTTSLSQLSLIDTFNMGDVDMPQVSTFYSEDYLPLVKQLQKQAGFTADGIVGARTIIFINSLLETNVPRLYGTHLQRRNL